VDFGRDFRNVPDSLPAGLVLPGRFVVHSSHGPTNEPHRCGDSRSPGPSARLGFEQLPDTVRERFVTALIWRDLAAAVGVRAGRQQE
jgi:hypothetical protein